MGKKIGGFRGGVFCACWLEVDGMVRQEEGRGFSDGWVSEKRGGWKRVAKSRRWARSEGGLLLFDSDGRRYCWRMVGGEARKRHGRWWLWSFF